MATKDTLLYRIFGLAEPYCDDDGYYNGRICPSDQARLLYWFSWIGMFTGIVGILNGWHWTGLGVCIGSLFAQMYWTDPTFSWRRTLDISWIQVLIWSHLAMAWYSPAFWKYVIIQLAGVGLFITSWWFVMGGSSWVATLTHAAVHLCANGSLLLLYLTPYHTSGNSASEAPTT
jgi:hypothetical protein